MHKAIPVVSIMVPWGSLHHFLGIEAYSIDWEGVPLGNELLSCHVS